MHPRHHAAGDPARAALILAESGRIITYAELEARANRAAHLYRSVGLAIGGSVAVLLDNHERYLEFMWAAQRSGLYGVCLSSRLTAAEIGYIVQDSGATAIVTSHAFAPLVAGLAPTILYVEDDPAAGFPDTPIADERAGTDMLYSSGTTGRPKGIRLTLPEDGAIDGENALEQLAGRLGIGAGSVYLGPAPLYHAAPLRWSMTVQRLGGTVVLMEKFDPIGVLATIERYRVTHSQWVPTHFVRLLKLPPDDRARHDLSSLKLAIHAAAPCPVPIKRAMIDWWGPVLLEYYAGTEGNGLTMIGSAEWLTHPGSVGRAVIGRLEICDEDGEPVPAGTDGLVHFADGPAFSYHNDPDKTAAARNRHGWTTLGDIGHVDGEGFLYLTDRQSFMIISGGVNIYPQEIENLLVTHPAVMDAAVIGAPDAEMGERVVAIVQPVDWSQAGDALAAELTAWLRERLSGVKTPRQIDFMAELPRHPTGKLYKRLLRDRYRAAAAPDPQAKEPA